MRFLSLDLMRYGHFTDRTIPFRRDARLHIVYGPNEAGKSSALSAFSDLLFGFPRRIGFDFAHKAADLRIGATIENKEGMRLSFRRRRGDKNTLLEPDSEKPLNDDALSPFLGVMEQMVFERAFALNSERLVQGGREMLADGGEIGQILFSAASGLTGLRAASDALSREADSIYAPRKSQSRSFYQALDRYDEARKAERERQLNASDWNALLKEERDIGDQFAAVEERQLKRQRRVDELQRLQRLRTFLAEIDGHRAALDQFEAIAGVDDGLASELATLEVDGARADEAIAALTARLEAAEAELAALVVDEELLVQRAAIGNLQRDSGLYEQALDALPARQHGLREAEDALRSAAMKLGFPSIEDLEKRLPNSILRSQFEATVENLREQRRARRAAREGLDRNRDALMRLEEQHGDGHLRDPAPLRRAYEALRDDLAGMREADALEVERADKARQLLDDAERLRPQPGDIMSLKRSALPAREELKASRDRLAAAHDALSQAETALAAISEECTRLEGLIAGDRKAGPVPTRDRISAARARRDQLFSQLGESGDAAGYAAAVRAADDLADSALDDAERVARHADNLRRLDGEKARRAEAETRRAEAAAALASGEKAYAALFSALDVMPATPEIMLEWLQRVEQLLDSRTALSALDDRLQILSRRNDLLLEALGRLAAELGSDSTLPLSALARAVEADLNRLAERWAEAREHEGALKAARQAIEKAMAEVERLEREEATVAARFAESLQSVGLPPETGLEGASEALSLWASLPSLLSTRDRLAREAEIDQARISDFEAAALQFCAAVAPDLSGEPPLRIAERLSERVAEHATRAAQRATLKQNAERLSRELDGTRQARAAIDARLGQIAETLPAGVQPTGLSARLAARADARRALLEARQRFATLAEGASEADIRTLSQTLDEASCRQELQHLEADGEEDKAEIEALRERRTALRHRKQALEAGEGSETAAFDRQSAEAEAQALARQWVVLKLAGRLIDGAMERHREGRADPILGAASRHFSTLTRGRFEGLSQAYGEQDALVLSARRLGGEDVPVEGLSDGTRDQLYLALRLAFLEDYAGRNEPPPLIVDDIFQTFDDERSAAGLSALAGLSGLQTILFTHETSMIDIARRALGDAADIIMLESA
ncbi:ATP-binding protein [Martelella limonii]|uniref:ATP-binding protein n=1 Tax=Martelella limonii TaxID=1647649 RepID=UPI0015807B0A|nr:YhaN family protein [Martelella limonii]